MASNQGLIGNIQRFNVHDGPGIRTVVFLKGCSLRCKWCANPEFMRPAPGLMLHGERCNKCGECLERCTLGALTLTRRGIAIDRKRCNLCFDCVDACPTRCFERVGRSTSIEEVVREVEKDVAFYRNSGGGVTFSGGDPFAQPKFLREICEEVSRLGIAVALETCGYAPWQVIRETLKHVQLVMYDVKHMDAGAHRKGTGVDNTLILRNLREVAQQARTWVRVPVIPGYNDSEENIHALGTFLSGLSVERVTLLPYHTWGASKYRRIGERYSLGKLEVPPGAAVGHIKELLVAYGLNVIVGA